MKRMLKLLVGMALLSGLQAAQAVDFTTPGTSNWVVPVGVNSITVEAWGGGGGGGQASGNPAKGGGGAGGQYAKRVVAVTAGASYVVVVGAGGSGGSGGSGNGAAGGDSTFGTTLVVAKGGAGGGEDAGGGGTGGQGSAAGAVGDNFYAGGNGSGGDGATGVGGAGGGGAGSTAAGGSAVGDAAGAGAAVGGGVGAAATAVAGACANLAGVAGGGGCGGYATSNANRSGGDGAAGKVSITYTVLPLPIVTTGAATGVTAWAAMVDGTVSSNGSNTDVVFEFGLTAAYGESVAAVESPLAAGAANAPVSAELAGLHCNSIFHYRVKATNADGTSYGADRTFTTAACTGPYPATTCAATRYGQDLACTSQDVKLTGIALAPGSIASCVSGAPVLVDLDLIVNFSSPNRWDVGIFIANDGKLPTLTPSSGGSASCSVDVLPTTLPFLDLDGVPKGTTDACGDGNSTIGGGTGSGTKRMTAVTLPCYASPQSGGKLFVPFVVTWDSQASPTGNLCTSNLDPVPNTKSRCNAPASSVAVAVVVLPQITKTNGVDTLSPGANTRYTVTIVNNSGGTLLDSVFTDPAVANLTVNSVSCVSANGAICPAATVADMQGAGITIPSANLPNNGSLTFTIDATVAATAPIGSHLLNTATVTVTDGAATSATDDDLIDIVPAATKSFAPNSITEGATSVLTITLINPTTAGIAGVSFTDNYPAGMVNAMTASPTNTCGGTLTAANNGNSVTLSGGAIPASSSCAVTVNVTSAAAASYTNSTGIVATSGGTIAAASAMLTVTTPVTGAFNACDVAAAPNAACTNTTTAATSHVVTKVAGAPFSLDLVALNANGTRNTNYNNTVQVQLLDASNNGGVLDANNCRNTWTAIATLAPNPAFAGANNGLITVGPFTVPEAYRDVRVRVTNVGGSAKTGCSTDNFAIRPNGFAIAATDTDWQTAGAVRSLANVTVDALQGCSAVGAPAGCIATTRVIHKAGQPFTLTAAAVNAAAATTVNYAGTPALSVGDCTPAGTACAASPGSFSLGVAHGFTSGMLVSNSASYSEVGAFSLSLQDTDFASVDAADTPATCVGRYVCGSSPVGRFVPDHFDTAVVATATSPMPCPAGLTCPLLYDGFVYSGQPFSVQVTARNATEGSLLNNYAGTLSRAVTLQAVDAPGGATPNPGGGTLANNGIAAASFGADPLYPGSAITAVPSYAFVVVPTAPTDIYLRAVDADGVTSLRGVPIEGGVKVVSGRARVGNAHGSELLPLPMTATVQYFDGASWLKSATDSVTSLALAASFDVLNKQGVTTGMTAPVPTGSATVSAGELKFKLGKPSGGPGSATIAPLAPVYLPLTSGLATFGIYKGNNEFIYLREVY